MHGLDVRQLLGLAQSIPEVNKLLTATLLKEVSHVLGLLLGQVVVLDPIDNLIDNSQAFSSAELLGTLCIDSTF